MTYNDMMGYRANAAMTKNAKNIDVLITNAVKI